MVALKIFDVLIQASHVYTVHIQWWLDWQEQACNHTITATWTPLLFIQRHIRYNNIYYNLCTPTDDISFIDKQCTSLLSVYRVSVKLSESNAMGVVPRLSQWQALPWDVNETYITVMNNFEDLLSSANLICFKQETGALHYNNVYSPYQSATQAVWLYI